MEYKVPSQFYFRIHHARPRFKSDVENVLIFVAESIAKLSPMSEADFAKKLNQAIYGYPGNANKELKTINNWRTEISSLFGFVQHNPGDIAEPGRRAKELARDGDLVAFFKTFLYSFQYPGAHIKSHAILEQIEHGIHFKPAQYLLRLLTYIKKVEGANKGFMPEYFKFIEFKKAQGMKMERFNVGALNQIKMLNDPKKYRNNFEIRNLAANGEVWTGKGTEAEKQYKGDPKLFDENVNSTALVITYGDFRYFNGGDLSGGNWKSYKSNERDMESGVARVCGNVDVIKANHHGYYDTCNGFFLNTLSPEVVVVDARSNNHPVPSTMTRMTDPLVWPDQGEFYITVDKAREKLSEELWAHFKPWGHIVVRVYEGGKEYQVFVLDPDRLDYPVKYVSEIKKAGVR